MLVACLSVAGAVSPLQAQNSGTLSVSAQVVNECTVLLGKSKREIARLARQLEDPSILRRCSRGVVSRVDRRVVRVPISTLPVARPSTVSRKNVVRRTASGHVDVVLLTVSY